MLAVEAGLPWAAMSGAVRRGCLVVTMIVLGIAAAGCVPGRAVYTQTSYGHRGTVSASATSGGLTITLTVTPSRIKSGAVVEMRLAAYERRAPGAFGYEVLYGDGTRTPPSAIPQFCRAGKLKPARALWQLSHRYRAAGSYHVSARVFVNCTRDHARATATVGVS